MSQVAQTEKPKRWFPNPKGVLMCCLACGRDTANKRGICHRCLSQSHTGHQLPSEMKDRSMLPRGRSYSGYSEQLRGDCGDADTIGEGVEAGRNEAY